MTLVACSTAPEVEPLVKQARWFDCSGTTQCTILIDDACRVVPINRRFALDYLDWSRAANGSMSDRSQCKEVAQRVASCHNNRCVEGIRFKK
ncbi:MAG: hypothetical protein AAF438_17130 [Pseudomonadota bacterium]